MQVFVSVEIWTTEMWFNVTVILNHKIKPFWGNLGGGTEICHRLTILISTLSFAFLIFINTNLQWKLLKVLLELLMKNYATVSVSYSSLVLVSNSLQQDGRKKCQLSDQVWSFREDQKYQILQQNQSIQQVKKLKLLGE